VSDFKNKWLENRKIPNFKTKQHRCKAFIKSGFQRCFILFDCQRRDYNTKSWNIPVVFYLLNGILEKSDLDGHLQGIFA